VGVIAKCNHIYPKGVASSTSTKINIPMFADDQVVIANSEDNLQSGVFTLQNVAKNYGVEL
jgi:hypothetical protein